jgi:glycosyltransferase involved in cell wall biosynthesis
MKIVYLHQYFKTSEEGGAIRSWYIASGMVQAGHEVHVITSHNKTEQTTKRINGITVTYLPIAYDNAFGFFKRAISFLRFIASSYSFAKNIVAVDLCYATSTPITVGFVALLLKRNKNIPYIFEVRDLWPEAPIQMGAIKNSLLKYLLFKLEKTIYARAKKIIALSPSMKDNIVKICSNKEVVVIPNMADCTFFQNDEKNNVLENTLVLQDKFVVSYIGSAGPSNNLMCLVDIIAHCKKIHQIDLFFIIQAAGSELQHIEHEVKKINYSFVKFLPYSNKHAVKELLNVSDAVYISFDSKPILQTNSPNKFFDALAAGRLVIVNTEGWIKDIVEKEEIGFYANPKNPTDFIEKIQAYINDKTRLHASQKSARRVAEDFFSVDVLVGKVIETIS